MSGPAAAFALRAPALRALAGFPIDAAEVAAVAQADDAAWSLFLELEQAALPLVRVRPAWLALPAVRSAVLHETRRVLAARAGLDLAAQVCRELGIRALVVKGGACLQDAIAVTLNDLDLLVAPADVPRLQTALLARGFVEAAPGGGHHEARLRRVGAVDIEVHRSLRSEAVPLPLAWLPAAPPAPGEPWPTLPPAMHAAFVLEHARALHPERRGRLRDAELCRALVAAAGGWHAVPAAWPGGAAAAEAMRVQMNGRCLASDEALRWSAYGTRACGLVVTPGAVSFEFADAIRSRGVWRGIGTMLRTAWSRPAVQPLAARAQRCGGRAAVAGLRLLRWSWQAATLFRWSPALWREWRARTAAPVDNGPRSALAWRPTGCGAVR